MKKQLFNKLKKDTFFVLVLGLTYLFTGCSQNTNNSGKEANSGGNTTEEKYTYNEPVLPESVGEDPLKGKTYFKLGGDNGYDSGKVKQKLTFLTNGTATESLIDSFKYDINSKNWVDALLYEYSYNSETKTLVMKCKAYNLFEIEFCRNEEKASDVNGLKTFDENHKLLDSLSNEEFYELMGDYGKEWLEKQYSSDLDKMVSELKELANNNLKETFEKILYFKLYNDNVFIEVDSASDSIPNDFDGIINPPDDSPFNTIESRSSVYITEEEYLKYKKN